MLGTHMEGGCIVEGQRECCHYAAEHHDEGDHAQHREALQLEGVALIEAFQLIVLKAQRVERAAARRLDGMVHVAAVAAAAPSAAASSCLGVPSSRAAMETERETVRKREREGEKGRERVSEFVSSSVLFGLLLGFAGCAGDLEALHVRLSKNVLAFFVARNH